MATRGRHAGAARSDTGKVVDLADFRRRKRNGEAQRQLTPDDCLRMLGGIIAPVGAELARLMEIPEKMHLMDLGDGSQPSLSSQPDRDIARVAGHLLMGLDFPEAVPDFGIIIASKGENAFCTLLDKRRKIIVCSPVRNAFAEQGSWVSFSADLKDALKHARTLTEGGERFDFAIVNDSLLGSR